MKLLSLSLFLALFSLPLFAQEEEKKEVVKSSYYAAPGPPEEGKIWVQVSPGEWVNAPVDSHVGKMARGLVSSIVRQRMATDEQIAKMQAVAAAKSKPPSEAEMKLLPPEAWKKVPTPPAPEPPKVDIWTTMKLLCDGKEAIAIPSEAVMFIPAKLETYVKTRDEVRMIEPKIRFPETFPGPFANVIIQLPSELVISPEGVYSYKVTKAAFEAAKATNKIVVSTFKGEPMMMSTKVVD